MFRPTTDRVVATQRTDLGVRQASHTQSTTVPTSTHLHGKRVAMVVFSSYPFDPRPRRAADALLKEGMTVDLICLADEKYPKREVKGDLDIYRAPIKHQRGGAFAYAYNYSAFILVSAVILALRSLRRRYDLVYIHNMPDILVLSSLVPKLLGAKVILDLHDPMPELMTTIFGLDANSFSVRLIRWLEKWSMARAHFVLTVNVACKRIFASRSCRPEKIGVVMNSPDEEIFPFRPPCELPSASEASAKRFVIMYHGSLVERNGLDLAVAALAKIRHTVPSAELRVYGHSTPFLEQVMEQVLANNMQDCVHYLGPKSLEQLVREIDGCDVGVIPNQRNAFTDINTPTRIFEYLALGKPVIAPRTPGIQDYFTPESLFFFDSANVGELAQQMAYVFSHPKEATETAYRGQQVYLSHRWPQERQTLVNLVGGLLAKS
ncbi:MAG: glycosyltransferase family 4 protein [Bryobacterales bacterium]|nr:glycosyltransferase family 4 protein [Bryobacterales bacterium]